MRRITFITLQPQVCEAYSGFGVFRRAVDLGLVDLRFVQLRDFAIDRHGTVDDRPYGGGDGMVLRPEPLAQAVEAYRTPGCRVLTFGPAGKPWTQASATMLQENSQDLILICGRFGGIDQRFLDLYVDEEISVGDFVVSGGELPALTIVDSLLRGYPGVLGHAESATHDSFSHGMDFQLEHPLYTRPETFEGETVPDVLRSGHHLAIEKWKREESLTRTQKRRPDLLRPKK